MGRSTGSTAEKPIKERINSIPHQAWSSRLILFLLAHLFLTFCELFPPANYLLPTAILLSPSPSSPYLFGILVALPARFRIWPFSATSAPRLASLRNPRTKRELSFLQPPPVPSPIFYSVHFRPPAVWLLPPIAIPHYFPLSRGLAPAFLVHFSLSFLHFLLTFLTTTTGQISFTSTHNFFITATYRYDS